MLKAIIFDCFGVLTREGWLPFLSQHFHDDTARLEQAKTLNRDADSGATTYSYFIEKIAQLTGISQDEATTQIEHDLPNNELFDLISASLKGKYKIGMLSNVGENRLDRMFTPAQLGLFDFMALSCEIGFVKPDIRAYQTVAAKLDVTPQECLFIDDQPRFCEGAIAAGMQAIHYTDLAQLKIDLEKLGIKL